MGERAYTVAEIDDLRRACENLYLWGRFSGLSGNSNMSRTYTESDKVRAVEETVRTYMTAGHTAEDLYASERP